MGKYKNLEYLEIHRHTKNFKKRVFTSSDLISSSRILKCELLLRMQSLFTKIYRNLAVVCDLLWIYASLWMCVF